MTNTYESYSSRINRDLLKKQHIVDVAAGRKPADLVLKNAAYLNVFANELNLGDIAVAEGLVVGIGDYSGTVEYDMSGKIVLPGFVDSHMHLESSLLSPKELTRALLPHGTTTVITDPHEIANVCPLMCISCCPPVCLLHPWTRAALCWIIGHWMPSTTIPVSAVWQK